MAHDTLLTYPDFNETFKTHTDASAFQLGAVIIQIEYVKVEKNKVADTISKIPLNGNQETTHKSTYQKEIVS